MKLFKITIINIIAIGYFYLLLNINWSTDEVSSITGSIVFILSLAFTQNLINKTLVNKVMTNISKICMNIRNVLVLILFIISFYTVFINDNLSSTFITIYQVSLIAYALTYNVEFILNILDKRKASKKLI